MALLRRSMLVVCASVLLAGILAAASGATALAQATWVGVIPQRVSSPPTQSDCPGGSLLHFQFDDEDSDNENHRGGWIGATISNSNTRFYVCRVDGNLFRPLSTAAGVHDHYAVLQLGASCPAGSTAFYRHWDHENTDNATSRWAYSGNAADFGPNTLSGGDSDLQFCLFRSGSNPMSEFPNIGIHYGVFAAPGFSRAVNSGWVATDDEDDNHNGMSDDADARQIIAPTGSDGRNTTVYLARVSPETTPVARCRVTPDSAVSSVTAAFSDNGSFARAGRSLVSYAWTFSSGSGASGRGPHWRSFGTGIHTGRLTVTDSAGETATAMCSVWVTLPDPPDCNPAELRPDDGSPTTNVTPCASLLSN